MARVSHEHLEARRRQILQGAAQCFARNGFHGTSMQDVFRETGLSAGAVYRYFPGKEAIIAALAKEVLATIGEAFDDALNAERLPGPHEILGDALRRVDALLLFPPPLVVQVWAETFRSEELADVLRGAIGTLLGTWTTIVEAYQRSGLMRQDVPAEHVVRALLACAQGFLVQRALLGPLDFDVLRDGLLGLMSFQDPGAPGSPHGSAAPAEAG
ncbi:TetR/AcrR family transcriptional regulator [Streptomyces sp. MP131-18]|uniref:TetR/AcrR family transcriptional regulator n=1 Tax=Streptomyces sp. MP131-18 TaxID=1857892 RepID=UPI00097BCE59|nr:TetR/AcrR family transcriptional regulator [Streptomyces sp. MP131-18]ONK13728.1 putative HTH-type transcriptional regulator YfiR [Streptomyces sp. MP131-18]